MTNVTKTGRLREEHLKLQEDYRVLIPVEKSRTIREKKIELVTFLSPSLLQSEV